MKGSVRIILSVALALLVLTAALQAQELMLPRLVKTIGPGHSYVRYGSVVYHIYTQIEISLAFEKIDARYTRLVVRPLKTGPTPFCELTIQWGSFPANLLSFGGVDGGTWTLDAETGYAEK